MKKVSFLGLGVMGYPMAGHLASQGYQVTVYNRTTEKARQWCSQYTGTLAETPQEAVRDAELVMMCVGNDDDVRQVGHSALSAMQAGTVLIDHTTASAQVARELYQACQEKQVGFLDAPVSGGQAGAENGQLTIMVGGDHAVYSQAETALNVYARHAQLLGESGSGQLAKMMNQICIAGIVQGLAEALHLSLIHISEPTRPY